MIYTIGHKITYLKAIAENGIIQKLGKRDGYVGGYAFQSLEDAQARIDEAYSSDGFIVFGLRAKWGIDTKQNQSGWWHNLIRSTDIILLSEKDGV